MKIDERHLVQLAAVIEAGGITEGAAMLGMSQPGVSRTLSMLEKRLGEPLFTPGRRPLQPTVLGRQLGLHGKSILAASRKASETVQGYKSGVSGRVRIGGVPFFMDAVVSTMIASFQVIEPDIQVDQSYGHLSELIQEVNANQIDLAITPAGTSDLGPEVQFDAILPGHNVIACGIGHPLLRKRRLTPNDVMIYPWVAPLPGSPLMLDLHSLLLSLGISELAIRYSGGSLLSVVNYIASTNALAILPHSVVFSLRRENKVSIVPLEIPQPERTLGIITKQRGTINPAARKLGSHIAQEFSDLKTIISRHERSIDWAAGPV